MPTRAQPPAVPRLTYLRIKNYRTLRDVEFHNLTPLTVLIGPNGSGKSTVLDALDFLAEAVRGNLVGAWEKRNRFAGMRTRGSEGAFEFEVRMITSGDRKINYHLHVNGGGEIVKVVDELLETNEAGQTKRVFYKISRDEKENIDIRHINEYKSDLEAGYRAGVRDDFADLFMIQKSQWKILSETIEKLTGLISSYRYIHLTDDHLKGYSDAGPREKLSPSGDNLPNVLYYLHTRHPETLAKITAQMRKWVPSLADIVPEITSDERILLRFKDAEFEKPLPAQYMSDGTMRLAALLTLLYEPGATGLLGLEEPENELHPQLLAYLAEELIAAADTRQLLVATHSPALLNALAPEQVWILHRGADGYSQATRTADLPGISAMVEEGTPLGYLWSRNFFDVGNPLDLPTPVK